MFSIINYQSSIIILSVIYYQQQLNELMIAN